MVKILIVDDEPQIRGLLSRIISLEGYEVLQAENLRSATKLLSLNKPEIVLCDVFLPDGNGVEFVPQIKELCPESEVIMLTAHGNIADGVQAIKNGAFDYLTKGDDNNRILPLLANAAEKVALKTSLKKLERQLDKNYSFNSIIGTSKAIKRAIVMAQKVAATNTSILLTGETGTGKEVFANAIHNYGPRAGNSFVAVNCSALSSELIESELFGYKAGAFTGALRDKKGLFEQANKGTIFLDEIGEMPLPLQAKLLRTLESGEFIKVGDCTTTKVDVRIIAATNRNLQHTISQGNFREDLYYRLSVFAVELPSLRERAEDVMPIAQGFIEAYAAKMGKNINHTEPSFFEALTSYNWPGNIRELRNAIERSVIMSSNDRLSLADLPIDIQLSQGAVYANTMELATMERQHIYKVLCYTSGNKTEAARLLKIGLTTLYRKLEEYAIK